MGNLEEVNIARECVGNSQFLELGEQEQRNSTSSTRVKEYVYYKCSSTSNTSVILAVLVRRCEDNRVLERYCCFEIVE
ncbi:hypothetical protein T08_8553 [Trichinella sp. T8]|nr:hypothetical protein T08_8553 [Trichinella sp. T8]